MKYLGDRGRIDRGSLPQKVTPHLEVNGLLIAGIESPPRIAAPEHDRSRLPDPVSGDKAFPDHLVPVHQLRPPPGARHAKRPKFVVDETPGASRQGHLRAPAERFL